jgi:phosphate transport system permease protein
MAAATTTPEINLVLMRGSRKRRRKERLVRGLFFAAAVLGLLISVAIMLALAGEAIRWLIAIDLGWLWTEGWFPRADEFDLLTILAGTFLIAVIAMLVAAPLGLGSAIYLSEYASPRARRLLKPIVELLAGVPSVVVAFFCLAVISPDVVQKLFSSASFFNLATAGLGVGILTIPLVATIAEDAMHAVPRSLREASYGIGARRRSTSLRVVVPAAVSGIVAALIVGLSRAIGETVVVLVVAGGTGGSAFTLDPLGPGQTVTGAMAALATGTDQVRGAGPAFESLFFLGILLFVLTFALNLVSERFVRRVRRRY